MRQTILILLCLLSMSKAYSQNNIDVGHLRPENPAHVRKDDTVVFQAIYYAFEDAAVYADLLKFNISTYTNTTNMLLSQGRITFYW